MYFPTRRRSKEGVAAIESQKSTSGGKVGAQDSSASKKVSKRLSLKDLRKPKNLLQLIPEKPCGLDYHQWSMAIATLLAAIWAFIATIMLLITAEHYMFTAVDDAREWYAVNGCANWARAEASRTLFAAFETRDALRGAVKSGLVSNPSDYAGIMRALSPVMSSTPFARQVEIGFSDRPATLSVGRRMGADGNWLVEMQSDSEDCYMLGLEGCVALPGAPAMMANALRVQALIGEDTQVGQFRTEVEIANMCVGPTCEDATDWEPQPELKIQYAEGEDANGELGWFPSYRLLFRTAFPHPNGTAPLRVSGRVTLELGGLNGQRLKDKTLGDDGRVYLTDSSGVVLASEMPSDILKMTRRIPDDPTSPAVVRLRNAWELEGSWASQLNGAFPGGDASLSLNFMEEKTGTMMHLTSLARPMQRFAILIVVPSREPFTNTPLWITSIVALVLAGIPYAIIGLCLFTLLVWQGIQMQKSPHLNPMNADDYRLADGRLGRLKAITRLASKRISARASAVFHIGKTPSMPSRVAANDSETSMPGLDHH